MQQSSYKTFCEIFEENSWILVSLKQVTDFEFHLPHDIRWDIKYFAEASLSVFHPFDEKRLKSK